LWPEYSDGKFISVKKPGVVIDQEYLKHQPGNGHPERPERIQVLLQLAQALDAEKYILLPPKPATRAEIEFCHGADYVSLLEAPIRISGNKHHCLTKPRIKNQITKSSLQKKPRAKNNLSARSTTLKHSFAQRSIRTVFLVREQKCSHIRSIMYISLKNSVQGKMHGASTSQEHIMGWTFAPLREHRSRRRVTESLLVREIPTLLVAVPPTANGS
jgi:hypothetical protein